nr:MAG TPA: hypothetical protein [Caudoviricetes sp.]DAW20053.1 MAG TPA: hypothetical protein [Caudoviricetes sp.]
MREVVRVKMCHIKIPRPTSRGDKPRACCLI